MPFSASFTVTISQEDLERNLSPAELAYLLDEITLRMEEYYQECHFADDLREMADDLLYESGYEEHENAAEPAEGGDPCP